MFIFYKPVNIKAFRNQEFDSLVENNPKIKGYYEKLRPLCLRFDKLIMRPLHEIGAEKLLDILK